MGNCVCFVWDYPGCCLFEMAFVFGGGELEKAALCALWYLSIIC